MTILNAKVATGQNSNVVIAQMYATQYSKMLHKSQVFITLAIYFILQSIFCLFDYALLVTKIIPMQIKIKLRQNERFTAYNNLLNVDDYQMTTQFINLKLKVNLIYTWPIPNTTEY